MVMISDRPAEAEDRAVPGHWEDDLIIGKDMRSAVAPWSSGAPDTCCCCTCPTVATRPVSSGRYTRPSARCRTSCAVASPGTQARRWPTTPASPSPPASRSTSATRTSHGRAAQTRASNGLLRQYMPKATDLSVHTADDLARYARSLNNRRRKTLGHMKPSERLAELLAHTG
jgi:hypothetical protein